ncbi:MAG: Arc family DNA-binding protein [bacterium]
MVSITLKDIPEQLHRTLKQRAQHHHRSLNKEVLVTLEMALHGIQIDKEVKLGTGRTLTARRASDDFLVSMDFGNEWEMSK